VTGINITQKLLNSLTTPKAKTEELIDLDKYLLHYVEKLKNETDFNRVMAHLYMVCFREFDKAWCAGRPTNIMNFTQILSDIFVGRFEKAIALELQDYFK